MKYESIFADFQNADSRGRVRLNTYGAISDTKVHGIVLEENKTVLLDDDDGLQVLGVLQFSTEENIWVAKINWDDLRSKPDNQISI